MGEDSAAALDDLQERLSGIREGAKYSLIATKSASPRGFSAVLDRGWILPSAKSLSPPPRPPARRLGDDFVATSPELP